MAAGEPRAGLARQAGTRTDGGYSVLEAVLLIPVLVVATLVVVQFALVWHARDLAQAAAESGVQAARLYGGSDRDGQRQARQYLDDVDPTLLPGARISVSRDASTVSVAIRAHVLTAAGIPLRFAISAHASAPVERFVADGAPTGLDDHG